MLVGVHICRHSWKENSGKPNMKEGALKGRHGNWSTYLPRLAHCVEVQCISVRENMVSSLVAAIFQTAKEQGK